MCVLNIMGRSGNMPLRKLFRSKDLEEMTEQPMVGTALQAERTANAEALKKRIKYLKDVWVVWGFLGPW